MPGGADLLARGFAGAVVSPSHRIDARRVSARHGEYLAFLRSLFGGIVDADAAGGLFLSLDAP